MYQDIDLLKIHINLLGTEIKLLKEKVDWDGITIKLKNSLLDIDNRKQILEKNHMKRSNLVAEQIEKNEKHNNIDIKKQKANLNIKQNKEFFFCGRII